jgi:uncharacterized protein (TIGR02246 family)
MKLTSTRLAAAQLVLASCFVFSFMARAQSKADDLAVRKIPQAFADAWANHDGKQLAAIMAADVDFVDVAGDWLRGRRDFELYHSRLLSTRFRDSTLTPLRISVRYLRPDLAVLHWSWKVEGDRNFDQTLRKPRFGLFTMIVAKKGGEWLVEVAQNTNRIPPPNPDPEMDGIKLGIDFPDGQ